MADLTNKATHARPPNAKAGRASTGILLVEENPTQAERLRGLLTGAGYGVTLAHDGESALARLGERRFLAVISDADMSAPVDGYELCRRLKLGPGPKTPVILLTDLADPLDIIRGLECGADNFFTKDVDGEHLLDRIRLLISTRKPRRTTRGAAQVKAHLLDREFTISSGREQVLDLLTATFEDAVGQHEQLRRREAELARSHQSLHGLYRISLGLNGAATEAEVSGAALERALELPGVRAGWISLRAGESGFRLVATRGLPPALQAPGALEGGCHCRRMLLRGELDGVANILECERLLAPRGDTSGLRYHAAIPLWIGKRTIGVMNLAGPHEGMFSEDDLRVLYGVGNQVAVALERAHLHEQLEDRVAERTAALTAEIAERKRAEGDRAQLASILEATTDFVATADIDGKLRYLNQAGRQLVGFDATEDISGITIADLHPERERSHVLNEVIPTSLQQGVWRGQATFRTLAGREVPVSISALAHAATVDSPSFLSAIVHDLTEHKRLEEQYRQAQKMEAVGRLAGGVAHDFNNLLTVIISYSEMLLGDLPAGDSRRADLEEIQKAAGGAAELTRQLLAFSRQQVLDPRVLDLNANVGGAGRMLQRIIGEDIQLVTVLTPGLGPVLADPGQIDQVVMNLVVNSRDAMPQGGKLTIETANAEMDETYLREHPLGQPGKYVMLAVSDTGTGMDEETQRRIFEPFFTTKGGLGTGLGLATVYGIVKQSGGFIWVYSELGHGTTFKIYLPRSDLPVEGTAKSATIGDSVYGSETVLLVEDAVAVRLVTRRTLDSLGYTVLEAADGGEALRVVAGHDGPIHLLLTDVIMPTLGGRQLAEQLIVLRPGLRVLFISGYTDDAVVRYGELSAGVAYLQKPFTPAILARKVREVLGRAG